MISSRPEPNLRAILMTKKIWLERGVVKDFAERKIFDSIMNRISVPALALRVVCLAVVVSWSISLKAQNVQQQKQQAELYIQTGHTDAVLSIAFSPDGKTLASASSDHTIKLWDTASGIELRTLYGHEDVVQAVAFSPDGKLLASGSYDSTIRFWDVISGKEIRSIKVKMVTYPRSFRSVAFSPDGKSLLTSYDHHEIKTWDVTTGSELHSFSSSNSVFANAVFSPDGRVLAGVQDFKTIKLWDAQSGRELRSLTSYPDTVGAIAFSPDGRTLAGAGNSGIIKLWDIIDGREIQTIAGHTSDVRSVAFSPDGEKLVSTSSDKSVKVWDTKSGRQLYLLAEHSDVVTSAAFSPDGQTIAGAGLLNIKLWSTSTKTLISTLEGSSWPITSLALSADGKTLASGGENVGIKLWDLYAGNLSHSLISNIKTQTSSPLKVSSLAFSPDGQRLISAAISKYYPMMPDKDFPTIWNVATGGSKKLDEIRDSVLEVALSPDGKTMAVRENSKLSVWDSEGVRKFWENRFQYGLEAIAFSPDGKMLVGGSADKTIKFWDAADGKELRSLAGHTDWVESVAFSPDGKRLASGGRDHIIKVWDVDTGRELQSFSVSFPVITKRPLSFDVKEVGAMAFSPDGKVLACSSHKAIKLFDITDGRELYTLTDHSDEITGLLFSLNGRTLISSSLDRTIKLWSSRSGEELATLIPLGEKDWLVATPRGFFDGSPAAWKQVIWRLDNDTFSYAPVEAFFSDYFRPGLLQDILNDHIPTDEIDISRKDIRQPKVTITLADNRLKTDVINAREIGFKVEVVDAPPDAVHPNNSSGARDLRLFRNGSLVKLWKGDVFVLTGKDGCKLQPQAIRESPRVSICTVTIPIVAGNNQFTAYAFNHDNVKSADATLTVSGADSLKRPGTAYILAIGVNTYINPNYNLKYAVADAEDFSAEFKRQQETLKNYGQIEVIPLYDKNATKANILQKLSELAAKAQPEDAVIVYFSGHGTAQQQRFYIIPYDLGYQGERTKLSATDLQTILSHSISDRELEATFEKIDAGQFLTVIDACNSGQALDAEEKRRGPMNSKGLAQLAYEKGMYVLTAAQSYQAAWEASRLGHGFLTYALIEEGLKQGKADREPKDDQIVLREWLDYTTERVPEMQEEKMKETPQTKDQQGRELELVFVEGDENIKDPAKRSVQRPRVFYRRETETRPLIIAKPEAIRP